MCKECLAGGVDKSCGSFTISNGVVSAKQRQHADEEKLGKHSLRLKLKGDADRIIPKKEQFT
jgi:hypothetical protein